jgi:hypothetical protein
MSRFGYDDGGWWQQQQSQADINHDGIPDYLQRPGYGNNWDNDLYGGQSWNRGYFDLNRGVITDHWAWDTDRDGQADQWAWDTDRDGRADQWAWDTDRDGRADRWGWDTDGDGKADYWGYDTDGDNKIDAWCYYELDDEGKKVLIYSYDTDGNGMADLWLCDLNHDGKIDAWAWDNDGNGKADQWAHDTNGDGRADEWAYDKNGDGKADWWAFDRDGDGKPDYWERDKNGDTKVDEHAFDRNGDGKPDKWIRFSGSVNWRIGKMPKMRSDIPFDPLKASAKAINHLVRNAYSMCAQVCENPALNNVTVSEAKKFAKKFKIKKLTKARWEKLVNENNAISERKYDPKMVGACVSYSKKMIYLTPDSYYKHLSKRQLEVLRTQQIGHERWHVVFEKMGISSDAMSNVTWKDGPDEGKLMSVHHLILFRAGNY